MLTKHEGTQSRNMVQIAANTTATKGYIFKELRKHAAVRNDPRKLRRKLNDVIDFLLELQLGKKKLAAAQLR